MSAHRYWRIYITSTVHGGDTAFTEIELHNSVGGVDLTGSGTASAVSAYPGYPASAAIDNNTTTAWNTQSSSPWWWKYDFGSGNSYDIIEIKLTPWSADLSKAPRDFQCQWSDDNTNWTTAFSNTGVIWASSSSKVFPTPPPPPNDPGGHRYWRLWITANALNGNASFNEIELKNVAGGNDLTGLGTASASSSLNASYLPPNAVDDNNSTIWHVLVGSTAPWWWAYDFGSGVAYNVIEITILPRQDGSHNQAPTAFQWQYSDDNSNWVTVRSVTTTWPSAAIQTFDVTLEPPPPNDNGGHRYWRIYATQNVTTQNLAFAEVELRKTAGGADITGFGKAFASSSYGPDPNEAVDNNVSSWWASQNFLSDGPAWWMYDFGPGVKYKITEIKITPRQDAYFGQAPTVFKFQYSDDKLGWAATKYITTTWPNATAQTFDVTEIDLNPNQILTQDFIEPIVDITTTDVRLSQTVIESIVDLAPTELRFSQSTIEVVADASGPDWNLRSTQHVLEVVCNTFEGDNVIGKGGVIAHANFDSKGTVS